ncbi:disintegrin and metalloproteinase domain-containing protein 28 [Stigmatopora argus]
MTLKLLFWVFVLNVSLKLSDSHALDFEEGKDYELVRTVRLHSVRRRDTGNNRPETIKYAMTVGGKDIVMHLQKNNDLLTTDYTETFYQEDGTQVTTSPNDIDHCYYHGKIVNESGSTASISTCDGLRGYFRTSAQKYLIEPLSGDDVGDHAVMKFTEQDNTPAVCGVTNTTWNTDFEPPTSRSHSRSAGISIVQRQKYIELYLVADNREYVKMKRDQTELRKRLFEIVNFVNMVYKPLRTFIALVGMEIWSNGDLISITPPAGANLNAFMTWRNSVLIKRKKHDNAHLISGIDFEGATVGLAFIGTLCSPHSVGVVQDHNNRAIAVGATLAHEMGHNLGMNHDDSSACACTGDSCIMAAALSWNTPRAFSSCSGSQYEKYLNNRNPSCMLDKPDFRSLVLPSVCGNGFVEQGEQCDCGTVEECTNPCCNATTCNLSEGSQCAAGECCNKCKIQPRSHECRSRHDECDLAEYCDGMTSTCPEDVFGVNGIPCDNGAGYCYNGQCPKRSDQCIKMYGASAIEARAFCYQQNTRGTYFAFCKRPSNDVFIPCQKEDVFCGKLFCHNGKNSPNYGRMVRFGDCKAVFFAEYTNDDGQVDTGTKCGEGKVCSENQCVTLPTAYRSVNCSAKCPGHSVCNHRSECQCEPGWLPPSCSSKDNQFSRLSSGETAAIAVTISLVVLGIIVAVIGVLWKKHRSSMLPTPRKERTRVEVDSTPFRANKAPVPVPPMQVPQVGRPKPKGPPPPPPTAGNQNYIGVRQALRPVPPPKV